MLGTEITTDRIMGTIGQGLDGNPVSPFEFDANNERGGINAMHIKNLTADKITSGTINSTVVYGGTITGNQIYGGTLTLGGTANGNGVMRVMNAAGTTAVQVDNTGITVNNGSITINDSSGSSVLDASGIVSTTQFLAASVKGSGNQNTDSSSYQNVSGVTVTFTLGREQNVLLFGEFYVYAESMLNYPKTHLLVDSTEVATEIFGPSWVQTHLQEILPLSAGSHTLKLQFKRSGPSGNGGVTMIRDNCLVGYVELGK